jgi:hypothetical protein
MDRVLNIVKQDMNEIDFDVVIRIGEPARFPNPRNYAYTIPESDNGKHIIVVSPKMLRASDDRIRAIIRHELAHAQFHSEGNFTHSEQDTDDYAEDIWGDRIFYDDEDLQTLRGGQYPRPSHLPR